MDVDSPALHSGALLALEQSDIAAAHAQFEPDGPWHLDHVNRAMVEQIFADQAPDARLENMSVADGHDGMTERRKWTLTWNAAGRNARLPKALFAKATPEGRYLRETLSLLHMAENEVLFYRHAAKNLGDSVPQSFFGATYAGGRFLLITEDLEETGGHPYWMGDDCSVDHAREVIKTLTKLHATFWESERLESDLIFARPRSKRFGAEWHRKSFIQARSGFLASENGAQLSGDARALMQQWNEGFDAVLAYWDKLPPTLLHGDSHLGNSYAKPDGSAGLFDWQVVYRGHGLRDVAYFLSGALKPDQMAEHKDALLATYFDELASYGVETDRTLGVKHFAMFALDSWDATVKTVMRGGYGHKKQGMNDRILETTRLLIENDVAGMIDTVVRGGKL